ncbi:MAG: hypothetical protein IT361_13685 [Gemmatimonadaceae bacterium]|nr:hypothetical protein [Gemmatimonadaceae bacterium]
MRRTLMFVVVPVFACSSSRTTVESAPLSGASATAAATTRGRTADVIPESEISQQTGVTNAYDLIRRLRPNFLRNVERSSLRTNSSAPLVRLNGQLLGELTELRGIEVTLVQEIRYFSIVEAESRWSGTLGRPVIAVTTKKTLK